MARKKGKDPAGIGGPGLTGEPVEVSDEPAEVIARAAAIWRRMEPTRDEIAVKGLKFLRRTL